MVGRLKQDRWTDPEGKTHSRVHIIAEHVEFKPQVKKGDGTPGEKREESAEAAAEEQEEVKEAASF